MVKEDNLSTRSVKYSHQPAATAAVIIFSLFSNTYLVIFFPLDYVAFFSLVYQMVLIRIVDDISFVCFLLVHCSNVILFDLNRPNPTFDGRGVK